MAENAGVSAGPDQCEAGGWGQLHPWELRLHDNGGKWGRGASSHCHLLTREIRSEEEKSDVV